MKVTAVDWDHNEGCPVLTIEDPDGALDGQGVAVERNGKTVVGDPIDLVNAEAGRDLKGRPRAEVLAAYREWLSRELLRVSRIKR